MQCRSKNRSHRQNGTPDRESAPPGASQHQLGTAVDFGSITDDFIYTKQGQWISENASKYGDYGSNIYINSGLNGDFVSFNVTNTGEEINSADYDKIFEKFSRIDNPLTRKVQGSGLGLYITKNLVEKMGGKISVNSQNRQTTFEVLMPSANIERQAQSAVSNIDN